MRKENLYIFLIAVVWLVGCASPKNTTVSTSEGTGYSEDLSIWRPKAEAPATNTSSTPNVTTEPKQTQFVEPKYAVNKKLDTVLDSIDRHNRARQFIDGFTIQIYAGMRREDALNAKKNLTAQLPDLSSEVEYAQPNFRVKVGKYFTRIDAQADFLAVKRYFPTAIVIPDKVAIE